jgi:hypothetical protein
MTIYDYINALRQYQFSADERAQLFALAMLVLFSASYIVITHRIGRR